MARTRANRTVTRRQLLRTGAVGAGALALPGLVAMPGLAGTEAPVTDKSVIFLFMQGGPSQFETFDPKMEAPEEVRSVDGEVKTSLPGVTFGGSMSQLAEWAHRTAIVRSFQTDTQHGGLKPLVSDLTGGASLGSVYARVAGTNHPRTGLPRSTAIFPNAIDAEEPGPRDRFGRFDVTGSLGKAYAPFVPGGGGAMQQSMEMNLSLDRFGDRRGLLKDLDCIGREIDSSGLMEGFDGMQQQAFEMVLRGVSQAFDISKEDPKTIARYDTSQYFDPKLWPDKSNGKKGYYGAHEKTLGKLLLLARRLCEAGCGFVSVNTEFVWDMHADGNNLGVKRGMKAVGLPFDHAVSAFIEDCEARGLSDKILLVCCGEMGRTPKINKKGGRDHWPRLGPLLLYGGGLTDGQVIGTSTKDGGEPASRKMTPDNLFSTIMHTLFDFGQVRLMPELPGDIHEAMSHAEKTRGVL